MSSPRWFVVAISIASILATAADPNGSLGEQLANHWIESGVLVVGEIEGPFLLAIAKRKVEPTERLASTHTPTRVHPALIALAQHTTLSHSGHDEKRPTGKFAVLKVNLNGSLGKDTIHRFSIESKESVV